MKRSGIKFKSKKDRDKKFKLTKEKLCEHGQYLIDGETECCKKW